MVLQKNYLKALKIGILFSAWCELHPSPAGQPCLPNHHCWKVMSTIATQTPVSSFHNFNNSPASSCPSPPPQDCKWKIKTDAGLRSILSQIFFFLVNFIGGIIFNWSDRTQYLLPWAMKLMMSQWMGVRWDLNVDKKCLSSICLLSYCNIY